MESLIGIKAWVVEAKKKIHSQDHHHHHQLLDQVYKNLEDLEVLVANMPEIRECQNFEPSGNSIRGMLHDFRCLGNFDEQVCRTFCKNLSKAIKIYRELALVDQRATELLRGIGDRQGNYRLHLKTINEEAAR